MATKKNTTKAKPKAKPKTQTGTATIKLLKGTASTRRPPNNPNIPQATIDHLNTVLNDLKTILDNYSQRYQKAKSFLARSLRYAQTPHINSWSFAKSKTPKLSGATG